MLFATSALLGLLAASSTVSAHMARRPHHHRAVEGTFSTTVRKHTREGTKPQHIIESDSRRLGRLSGKAEGEAARDGKTPAAIENSVVSYVTDIGFGTPATSYSLIVDTGSSNTFAIKFKKTPDAINSGNNVSVTYGSGSFSGKEFTDTITLVDGLVLKEQGVARATVSQGFNGVDGILGVGPTGLTDGTVQGQGEIPTVMDTAVAQGLISKNVLGVFFAPTTEPDVVNGLLTYGGIAKPRITSDVTYQTVTTEQPSGRYWGLTLTSNIGSGTKQGIVDTGTTLIYLPQDWYNAYLKAIPSSVVDSNIGLISFPKSSLNKVPNLTFTIGEKDWTLNKFAQIVPQDLYDDFGMDPNKYYSWVGTTGSSTGLSFILGQKFLERFYSVYDVEQNRIGLATTKFSNPTSIP